MEKISCDIVRDLMPGYLDGICSEDSRRLLDKHMEQCPACKDFIQQVQKVDYGKETAKVDGLRKARRALDIRVLLCFMVSAFIFLVMGVIGERSYGSLPQNFFRVSLPILMFTYYIALAEGRAWNCPQGKEWILPGLSLLTLGGVIAPQIYTGMALWKENLETEQMVNLGPFMYRFNFVVAICSMILLVVFVYLARRHNKMFLLSQNLVWLTLHLAFSFGSFLKSINCTEEVIELLLINGVILALESACVLVCEIVLYCIRSRK